MYMTDIYIYIYIYIYIVQLLINSYLFISNESFLYIYIIFVFFGVWADVCCLFALIFPWDVRITDLIQSYLITIYLSTFTGRHTLPCRHRPPR